MNTLVAFVASLALLSLGCGLMIPTSNSGTQPAIPTETLSAPATFTPVPTLTEQPPTHSSPPPAARPPEADYLLQEERLLNGYAIRIWRNPTDQLGFESILLIEAPGQTPIRVDKFSALHDLTGGDLNGDTYPDVVVETFSGGAHCCFGTQVYSLRPDAAALILKKPESNAGGYFEDLDGDNVHEFITFDDSFAYQYCPYAAGVTVKVIMAFDVAQDRYLPASPRFPEQYTQDIATHEGRALAAPGELGEWDSSNMCAVLPLVLDHLYLGQPDIAQTEFSTRYNGKDAVTKWGEILQVVQGSLLYKP